MTNKIIEINGIQTKASKKFPNYSASICGRIFRISSGKEMKQTLQGIPEYMYIRTCHNNVPKNTRVHILVADAWCDNGDESNKICVNHKDGNKLNNHADNLEWSTHSENTRHAVEKGLIKKGEGLYNSELKEEEVHEICKHLVDGWRIKDISDKFEVSKDIIRKIRAGDTWFHVRNLYEIPHTYLTDFSEGTVRWVCDMICKGFSDKVIANTSTNDKLKIIDVKRIRHKIRYRYISFEYF